MAKKTLLVLVVGLLFIFNDAKAGDTLRITSGMLETARLQPGTNRYFVYVKMDKNQPPVYKQLWTRKVARTTVDGRQVINITQYWEDNDSVMHTVESMNDATTMAPIRHKTWWKRNGEVKVDFREKKMWENSTELTARDTAAATRQRMKAFETAKDVFSLNWHLDLEIFPLLPFKEGAIFEIPFYDPGTSAPLTKAVYVVAGSDTIETFDNWKVDCWVLTHTEKGNAEKFWISKRTNEVVKMEQLINDKIYRYKIKLDYKN